jgi:tRNA threonylcarbamoyladenosine biosynthesis protein TsaE
MLAHLGISGPVQSPTYTYVSVYFLSDGRTVYHFDLYRLSSYEEFIQAGFDEYLYDPSALCFIEWPEILKGILPPATARLTLEYISTEKRQISVE